MADALESAAIAFDRSMGNANTRPVARTSDEPDDAPPEALFGNLGENEGGEAGGDDLPDPKPTKKPAETPDEDEEDLEEDEDEDKEADEEDEEEGDDDEGLTDEEKAAKKLAAGDEDDETMNQEFTVMVDGVEKTVKLKEALEGYIRTDTFHQRLNQLEDVRKTVVAEGTQVVKDRQTYIEKLQEAEDILKEMMPDEPDWDAEFTKDGVRANALRKQYDQFKGKVAEIRTKREAAVAEQAENTNRATLSFAQQEFPRFVKAAGWKSQEDQARDTKSMRRTALSLGFTEQEVATVYDSRLLQVLLKASKYDRMMASRPKAVKQTVNGKSTKTPGAGSTRTAPKEFGSAMSKLSRTGSIDDAANVFDRILSTSKRRKG